MKKKTKVIHLLSSLPYSKHLEYEDPKDYFKNPEYGDFERLNDYPYWVGYFVDHHVLAAKDITNFTSEFDIECWRPYGNKLKKPYQKMVNDIKHRVFPAKRLNIPQVKEFIWSKSLYKALLKEIKENNIILEISVGHAWFHIWLMLKLAKYKKKFAMIALHRSSGFRHLSYKKLKSWKKLFKWYYLIEGYLDIKSLKKCDHYFIGAFPERDYLNNNYPEISSSFYMTGIDFSQYKVFSKNEKKQLRIELGLPIDKTILIAQGNWRSDGYGYQKLINVFKQIKKMPQGNDLELILIGGNKSEDLYNEGIKAGAIMVESVPKGTFIKYMQASDIFTKALFTDSVIEYGGFGTSSIEALACGLPIITNNIIHFPGSLEERNQIGLDMPNSRKLLENIFYIKNNLHEFNACREIAENYYDLNYTLPVVINKYRELAKKYYGT